MIVSINQSINQFFLYIQVLSAGLFTLRDICTSGLLASYATKCNCDVQIRVHTLPATFELHALENFHRCKYGSKYLCAFLSIFMKIFRALQELFGKKSLFFGFDPLFDQINFYFL